MVLDVPAGMIARPIVTIDEGATVLQAAKAMASSNRGSIIAMKGGKSVGILTERDILKKVVAMSLDPAKTKVGDAMTSPLITIDKASPLREAIDLMNRKGLRRMLVTDGGTVVGIFTLRDIVRHSRMCMYCGKEIKSELDAAEPDSYIDCKCGARYHTRCAETVVHCVSCSTTLVLGVTYPEPSETFSG